MRSNWLLVTDKLRTVQQMSNTDKNQPGGESVAPFPLWRFPPPLADFITEASIAMSCPPDYIAVPMLAVLGTAIGTGHRLQIKEGWNE